MNTSYSLRGREVTGVGQTASGRSATNVAELRKERKEPSGRIVSGADYPADGLLIHSEDV